MTEQEKREKVIKGLECCIDEKHGDFKNCFNCDYRKDVDHLQYVCDEDRCIADAIALLKAQEPVKPKFSRVYDYDIRIFACGACGKEVGAEEMWNYCLHCGKAAKWDD